MAQCVVDDLKVHRRVLPVEPPQGDERRLQHGEPVRTVPVRHGREDGKLDLLLGDGRVGDLGHASRTAHQRLSYRLQAPMAPGVGSRMRRRRA
jgi:hypothetical protein